MELKLGYKQTEVGVIPESWVSTQFGQLIDLLTGFPFQSKYYSKSGVRLVRGSNVKRGSLDWSEDISEYWPSITADISRYALNEGDLVVAMDGALVGKSYAVISISDLPCLLLQRVARIRSRSVHAGLLAYLVGNDSFVRHVDSVKTQTAIPHISPRDIRTFPVAIPTDPTEQCHIATALSEVDRLIGALDKLTAKKRDVKQAAMQQLLTGQTHLPGFSGDWDSTSFGNVLSKVNAKEYQIQTSEYQKTGIFPVVDQGKEFVVGFSDREDKRFHCPQGGVIVFGDHTCIVKFVDFDFVVGADGTQILATKVGHCARFHAYQLQHLGIPTTGYNRHFKFLKERPFDAPSLVEQTAIAAVLSDMDRELAALEQMLAKTRALKQGMMQELLTGRTRLV